MYKRITLFIIVIVAAFGVSRPAFADVAGEHHTFFVNPTYDISGRTSVAATLQLVSAHAYFYMEDSYINSLSSAERQNMAQKLAAAAQDFEVNIYPNETSFWGSEPNPGIDNDPHLTIFLERLGSGTGGYFDSVNDYPTEQATSSNQREMLVANVLSLANDHLKIFLAHELQHLISFNQKEILNNVSEEVWLNELRSQYAITLAGFNNVFQNSDLQQRVQTFLQNPSDSVTDWPNSVVDYAPVTLFGHYLADRFGPFILQETLRGPLTGVASVNKWLTDHGQSENFTGVFGDWVWANYINSYSHDPRFGYSNPNLQSLRAPLTDSRQLSAAAANTYTYSLKPYQPTLSQFIVDPAAPSDKNIKISWHNPAFRLFYADSSTDARPLADGDVIPRPSQSGSFILMPVNESKTDNLDQTEAPATLALTIEYVDQPPASVAAALKDGDLIMHAGTPDIYVVTGTYKRLLAPDVLKFYGLNASAAVTVSEAIFQSYRTANYIRSINEKKVYAVWPDGTKHWLNISAQQFTDSHRDWNSVFIVNDLESNYYKIGPDIRQ